MTQSGFASTGYALFGAFNHVELLLGAIVLSGLMVLIQAQNSRSTSADHREKSNWRVLWPALVLFAIPLLYNYGLTPHMSALGLPLTEAPVESTLTMNAMHAAYWGLELMKLSTIALLIYRLGGRFGLDDGAQLDGAGGLNSRFDLAKPE
jgi:hypothetical protein